jgi:hypothetical protein
MVLMHKCQGYWVSREVYDVVEYRQKVAGIEAKGFGSPGVRFNREAFGTLAPANSILLTFGGPDLHTSGGPSPNLAMPVESAVSLISLLRAAVTDALIADGYDFEPFAFADVTAEPCTCPFCTYVREQEQEPAATDIPEAVSPATGTTDAADHRFSKGVD